MNWLYEYNEGNSARYILGKEGKKTLVCIGVNPSTATPERLDNTLKSVGRISCNNEYDSWTMINLYPQRATNPCEIHKNKCIKLHDENIKKIKTLLNENRDINIWAAWGTLIETRDFLKECLRDIYNITRDKKGIKWFSVGTTNEGHPRHPLYVKKDTQLIKFDIENYCK